MMSELLSASRAHALAYACQSAKNSFPKLEANTVDTIKPASLALILDSKELRDDDLIAFANRGEARPAYRRAFDAQLAAYTGKPEAS